jgi:hypothetical protein
MRHLRVLYALVKADFLERIRRYGFFLSLGFAVYLGYGVFNGTIQLRLGPYHGIGNSAWIGSVIGLVATQFLTLMGFYVVKGTIQRDRETGVGQILATTPISKVFYTLSKVLSNFSVLAFMILILAAAALITQIVQSPGTHIDFFALLSPVLILGLCAMLLTSAITVVFECLPLLRGGVGNILWFFVWTALVSSSVLGMINSKGRAVDTLGRHMMDFTGISSVIGQMQMQLLQLDSSYEGGASFSVGGGLHPATKTFLWAGVHWDGTMLFSRVFWLGIALGLTLLAALFFDRFDPARGIARESRKALKARLKAEAQLVTIEDSASSHVSATHLTPLVLGKAQSRFLSLVLAEFRLLILGHPWWWYSIAAVLFVGCVAAPLNSARSGWILIAWFWPTLLWSQLGTQETQFQTQPLIRSAARSFPRQFLAMWMAGLLLAVVTGGGLALHLIFIQDWPALGAWTGGALFIPSLALAAGSLTQSRKTFEALYTAWWYIGPMHHNYGMDFIGTTTESSTALLYVLTAIVFVSIAFAWRRTRLALA